MSKKMVRLDRRSVLRGNSAECVAADDRVDRLAARHGGRRCVHLWGRHSGLLPVVWEAEAANIAAVDLEGAVADGIAHIAFDNLHGIAGDRYDVADMVGRSLVVRRSVVRAVLPVIENDVTRAWNIGVVFLPASEFLEQLDMLTASALGRDDVGEAAFDGDGADEGAAPRVGVLHLVASGEGRVAVIGVDNFAVAAVCFFATEPCNSCVDDGSASLCFCHIVFSFLLSLSRQSPRGGGQRRPRIYLRIS